MARLVKSCISCMMVLYLSMNYLRIVTISSWLIYSFSETTLVDRAMGLIHPVRCECSNSTCTLKTLNQ
jgi:hypothetical protein